MQGINTFHQEIKTGDLNSFGAVVTEQADEGDQLS